MVESLLLSVFFFTGSFLYDGQTLNVYAMLPNGTSLRKSMPS